MTGIQFLTLSLSGIALGTWIGILWVWLDSKVSAKREARKALENNLKEINKKINEANDMVQEIRSMLKGMPR